MKIQFTDSPTGEFKLAYSAGQIAELPDALAQKLIEAQYAVKVETPKRQTKAQVAERRGTVSSDNPTVKRAGKSRRGKKSS